MSPIVCSFALHRNCVFCACKLIALMDIHLCTKAHHFNAVFFVILHLCEIWSLFL